MLETIFQVSVIVLVGLGMNDDRVIDLRRQCKLHIGFQRHSGRFISCGCVIGYTRGIEQMNVGINQWHGCEFTLFWRSMARWVSQQAC